MGFSNLKIISLVLVCLLSLNFIFALGVSSPYWSENPLKMYPGQTKDVAFTLVNKADGEVEKAFVVLKQDAGIVKLKSGDEYTVNPGSKDAKIILTISVPEDASLGQTYDIKFSAKSAPLEEGGMAQLTVGYNVDFPIEVVEKSEVPIEKVSEEVPAPEKEWNMGLIISIILAILVIIIIIWFVMKKKNPVSTTTNIKK